MNFDQMKLVDYLVGGVVCFVIGVWRRFIAPVDPARKARALPVRSIGVIKFLGLGSILQALDTVQALRERFPDARLTLFTTPENRAFCELFPQFDEVVVLRLSHPWTLARDLATTVWRFRREGLDLVLDLEFFSNFSAFFTALIGGTWSIGFATPKSFRNWIFCEVVSFDHGRHISDIFYKAARALGLSPRVGGGRRLLADLLAKDRLRMDRKGEEAALDAVLSAHGRDPARPLIVVNVNAGPLNLNRRWPVASFRELVDGIQRRDLAQIALIGGASEAEYVGGLVRGLSDATGVMDLSGRLSIRQLILLLARADLYLGNDSGPLHIAESVGTQTVSFFGPETPRLYGPQGPEHLVFYKELPCSPCLNVYNQKSSDCRDNQCLKQIPVGEVSAALAPVLEGLVERKRRTHARADAEEAGADAGARAAGGGLVRAAERR
jgi:ADP-heptose:LPS heptosyltransferase